MSFINILQTVSTSWHTIEKGKKITLQNMLLFESIRTKTQRKTAETWYTISTKHFLQHWPLPSFSLWTSCKSRFNRAVTGGTTLAASRGLQNHVHFSINTENTSTHTLIQVFGREWSSCLRWGRSTRAAQIWERSDSNWSSGTTTRERMSWGTDAICALSTPYNL